MYRYMKSSASESVRNACFNLEQFSLSSHLARIYFGVALIQTLNFHVPKLMHIIYNTFCRQFDQNEHYPPFEFSSARIKIGV